MTENIKQVAVFLSKLKQCVLGTRNMTFTLMHKTWPIAKPEVNPYNIYGIRCGNMNALTEDNYRIHFKAQSFLHLKGLDLMCTAFGSYDVKVQKYMLQTNSLNLSLKKKCMVISEPLHSME